MTSAPPYNTTNEHRTRQFFQALIVYGLLKKKHLVNGAKSLAADPDCRIPHYCRPHLAPPSLRVRCSLLCAKAIIIAMKHLLVATTLGMTLTAGITAAQQSTKPDPQKSQDSPDKCALHDAHAKMNERGEKGMGFSQTANTHHFLLKPDGGAIQVEANDPKDNAARDSIRTHLTHIAHSFSAGDFDIPMFVHDTVPPGVPDMKRLKEKITYSFQETPSGGRVVIATSDPESLAVIHKFLRFQIDEHQTHDPVTVQ
jgi:hypothetical protein